MYTPHMSHYHCCQTVCVVCGVCVCVVCVCVCVCVWCVYVYMWCVSGTYNSKLKDQNVGVINSVIAFIRPRHSHDGALFPADSDMVVIHHSRILSHHNKGSVLQETVVTTCELSLQNIVL